MPGRLQYPVSALNTLFLLQAPQKWQLGVLISLYLSGQIVPQLLMHRVIFSPIRFLYILLLRERYVPVQALQLCCKGSQVPACLTPTL